MNLVHGGGGAGKEILPVIVPSREQRALGVPVQRLEGDGSFVSCVSPRQSHRCVIRDSCLHDPHYHSNGGAGYGFDVTFGSSDNLLGNNISIRPNKVINCRASAGGSRGGTRGMMPY